MDFGEERKFWMNDSRIKDENEKPKNFNSPVDGINYLGNMGWKLVNAFPVQTGNGISFY